MKEETKRKIYWKLTHFRDKYPFTAWAVDYMRYEWFFPLEEGL